MTRAVVPGSFDPVTLGHRDVIGRATTFADDVVVAVAHNSAKAYLFDLETRVALLHEAVADLDVRVDVVEGLLADYCRDAGAHLIVKGVRGGADVEHETAMATVNRRLAGVETVMLVADGPVAHISSTIVKDVARHGGDVSGLVPPGVVAALAAAFADGATGTRPPGGIR